MPLQLCTSSVIPVYVGRTALLTQLGCRLSRLSTSNDRVVSALCCSSAPRKRRTMQQKEEVPSTEAGLSSDVAIDIRAEVRPPVLRIDTIGLQARTPGADVARPWGP